MQKVSFTIISFLTFFLSNAQYSTYYGTVDTNVDVNANVNINKNVNVSGEIKKTVTTIDYGALRQANAMSERNRLDGLKLANERERDAILSIIQDPFRAFSYGRDNNWVVPKSIAKTYGFKKLNWYHKVPHNYLFSRVGDGYNYQNISQENITTEIEVGAIFHYTNIQDKSLKAYLKKTYNGIFTDVEDYVKAKANATPVGEIIEGFGFIHKVDINKTKVYSINGFKLTIVYENDYEIVIKDNYYAVYDGVIFHCGLRVKGDKDEVTFESLEGRRAYFRRLSDQIISTAKISNVKK